MSVWVTRHETSFSTNTALCFDWASAGHLNLGDCFKLARLVLFFFCIRAHWCKSTSLKCLPLTLCSDQAETGGASDWWLFISNFTFSYTSHLAPAWCQDAGRAGSMWLVQLKMWQSILMSVWDAVFTSLAAMSSNGHIFVEKCSNLMVLLKFSIVGPPRRWNTWCYILIVRTQLLWCL